MRFVRFQTNGQRGVGISLGDGVIHGLLSHHTEFPGDLPTLIDRGRDALASAADLLLTKGMAIHEDAIQLLPPVHTASKIICVGLNYTEHARESECARPDYPTIFARFNSSLVGHRAPLVRPRVSEQFDFEGELVAVIGRGGRRIPKEHALAHVIGYSIFNDASVRDYQVRTSQWTMGKNFDGTGAFGPWLVSADDLPPGATGLRLQTRLRGEVVQDATTADLIFDVATLISVISEVMTLNSGDLIVTGTPAGVGVARKPQLFMKAGDVCEVKIEGIGTLVNDVVDET